MSNTDSNQSFLLLNTVIIPDSLTIKAALATSQQLFNFSPTYFTLDNVNFFPHLTLYQAEYPKKNLDPIISALRTLSTSIKSFKIAFTKFDTHFGYVDIETEISPQLLNLHQSIIKALNPFREDHQRSKYQDRSASSDLNLKQLDNIQKYGYPDALDLYRPHLTLTRFTGPSSGEKSLSTLTWTRRVLHIRQIGLYFQGDNGTCIKPIQSFQLHDNL